MRGFDFKGPGFFICTETAPRCYVIQEVSDVNRAYDDVTKSNSTQTNSTTENNLSTNTDIIPSLLPWWFTSECRQQLLNVSAPSPARTATPNSSAGPYEPSATPEPPGMMTEEQLKQRLKSQLEYYFSRENLMNDRYLRSQMDADQYVPIKTIARFPKVSRLSDDYELIVSALRDSAQVQVDETGQRVRPVSKRCTIILREIPEDADENEVKAMFDGCPKYQSLAYGLNNSWYVTFADEEQTQRAFVHLQNVGKTFNGKPIYARIKTGGAPIVHDTYQYGAEDKITTNAGTAYKTNVGITPGGETVITGQITIHEPPLGEAAPSATSSNPTATLTVTTSGGATSPNGASGFSLGQFLAQHGFVPRASFRPSVTSTAAMAAAQGTAAAGSTSPGGTVLGFSTPTVPASMPMTLGGNYLSPQLAAGQKDPAQPSSSTTVPSNAQSGERPKQYNSGAQTSGGRSDKSQSTPRGRRSPFSKASNSSTATHSPRQPQFPQAATPANSNALPLNRIHTQPSARNGANIFGQRDNRSSASGEYNRQEYQMKGERRGTNASSGYGERYPPRNADNSHPRFSADWTPKYSQQPNGGPKPSANRSSATGADRRPNNNNPHSSYGRGNYNRDYEPRSRAPTDDSTDGNSSQPSSRGRYPPSSTGPPPKFADRNFSAPKRSDFGLVDAEFPSLIERSPNRDAERPPNAGNGHRSGDESTTQPQSRMPFSAIVAGRNQPPVAAATAAEEPSYRTYAQTLKKK